MIRRSGFMSLRLISSTTTPQFPLAPTRARHSLLFPARPLIAPAVNELKPRVDASLVLCAVARP